MASAMSLASIIGPLLMTQTFTYFTSPRAPIYLPGSAFIIAAILTVVALAIFLQQVRKTATGHASCTTQQSDR
ncbi:MAG: hypothetical protein CM15mP68_6010 [Pseudomonadota bacterium]|nr:MAG: hypothetical protein CM15mP68_6010 [Pseudomonadota bacterium]